MARLLHDNLHGTRASQDSGTAAQDLRDDGQTAAAVVADEGSSALASPLVDLGGAELRRLQQ